VVVGPPKYLTMLQTQLNEVTAQGADQARIPYSQVRRTRIRPPPPPPPPPLTGGGDDDSGDDALAVAGCALDAGQESLVCHACIARRALSVWWSSPHEAIASEDFEWWLRL
jgi:hypothetical protein